MEENMLRVDVNPEIIRSKLPMDIPSWRELGRIRRVQDEEHLWDTLATLRVLLTRPRVYLNDFELIRDVAPEVNGGKPYDPFKAGVETVSLHFRVQSRQSTRHFSARVSQRCFIRCLRHLF
ncbi:hypothetical protein FKP32DRAFT_85286 [Trametes sanguinea]|nr:hypothetical protein FKP32DRAFT_85286 [Trametes sanguinea]